MKMKTIQKSERRSKQDEPDPSAQQQMRDGVSMTVNAPFRGAQFASNKKLTEEDLAKLESTISQQERLLFVVVGDLSIKNQYAKSILAVTDKQIYGFDKKFEGGMRIHTYDRVKRAYVKRYYGNAMLIFSMDDSEKEFVDLTKEYVNFIQLYLYSSEQNHRAMLAYMNDSGQEGTAAYTHCQTRADMIEQQLAYFIHISAFLEDDCSDRTYKDSATEDYLKLFQGVDPDVVPRGVTVAAEQAIYRAAMEDMGVGNITHDITDLDADGEKELLVVCDDLWEDWPSYIVIDPNNYAMGSYTDSFSSYSDLRQTAQGEYRILRKFDDGTSVSPLDMLVWTDGGFVFQDVDPSLQETSLPSPNLTEQNIAGDTKALLKQLDSYFDTRPDCARYAYDLNGDGNSDRAYLLINAADMWTKLCQVAGSFGGEHHLYYDDDKVTVLTAETQTTGVLLRVCRLDFHGLPKDIVLSEADRTITADNYIYSYQPTGAPFICQQIPEDKPCAADLMGLTREQLQQVVESYNEESETTAYGYCQGGYLSITYTDGVLTHLGVSSWNGEPVPLIDGIHTGNTLLEMLENAQSLGDWTNFERMGEYYYATSSSYRDSSGNNYIFTAAFDGTTPDSVLLYATFALC